MRFSILADIEAIMGADELEVRLIDVVETMLIIGFVHPEDAEVGKEGEETQGGDGSGNGGGMVLLDSTLEEITWKLLGEGGRLC
jgi:hypothetical protein